MKKNKYKKNCLTATLAILVLLTLYLTDAHATFVAQPVVVQDPNAVLNGVTFATGVTLTPILSPAGFEYNNIGYRKTDGLLYALQLYGTGFTGGNNGIITIDSAGTVTGPTVPTGLPTTAGTRFDSGDVSTDGTTMFITMGTATNTPTATLPESGKLYKVNLPSLTLTGDSPVTITGSAGQVSDWTYNSADGLLYGGDSTNGQLAVLDPATGARVNKTVTGLTSGSAFGAAWYDQSIGRLFLYQNSGMVYEINTSTSTIANSWTAPVSTRNDGAWIPEPASFCIFGLGALAFLRKRN